MIQSIVTAREYITSMLNQNKSENIKGVTVVNLPYFKLLRSLERGKIAFFGTLNIDHNQLQRNIPGSIISGVACEVAFTTYRGSVMNVLHTTTVAPAINNIESIPGVLFDDIQYGTGFFNGTKQWGAAVGGVTSQSIATPSIAHWDVPMIQFNGYMVNIG